MGVRCDSQPVCQDCRLSEAHLFNTLPEKDESFEGKIHQFRGFGDHKKTDK